VAAASDTPSARQDRAELDLYQVLGVHPTATLEQIKAAFRRQALKHHPDKNSGSPQAGERFKQCNDAYATLSDPERRGEYDARHDGRGMTALARDLIEDVILGRRRARRRPGRDLRYTLELPFRDAALGASCTIHFPVAEPCSLCGGVGAAAGGTRPCPQCDGKGEERDPRALLPLPRRCPRCGGQGIAIAQPCAACGGVGSLERIREYQVTLRPGIADCELKRLPGEGEPGLGGAPAGELQVLVRVRPDPLLRPAGEHDLETIAPVGLAACTLGGAVEVPTLEGPPLRLKIPPGTQSGTVFRLRGKGRPHGAPGVAERGDLLVRVEVEAPDARALDGEARRLLAAFEARCGELGAWPRQREYVAQLRPADEEPGDGS
jgi:molecular chaperone DnaJ